MTVDQEPRAVRRGRVRMARGGRKGARASIRVATYEAALWVAQVMELIVPARSANSGSRVSWPTMFSGWFWRFFGCSHYAVLEDPMGLATWLACVPSSEVVLP